MKKKQTYRSPFLKCGSWKNRLKRHPSCHQKGNGKAVLTKVQGRKLTAWMNGKDLYITDENGGQSKVIIPDVWQSNGVIHCVDALLIPRLWF